MVNTAFQGTWRLHTKFGPDWSSINFFHSKWLPVDVAMAKLHPLPCPHVSNNAHLGSWRARQIQQFLSKCLAVMPRHTYIQAYIHTCKPKKLLKWVRGSNSLTLFRICYFLVNIFTLHTNGKRCRQEGSHPCYSLSLVVYAYHDLRLSLKRFVLPKYHLWPFFGLIWTKKWVWSYTCT